MTTRKKTTTKTATIKAPKFVKDGIKALHEQLDEAIANAMDNFEDVQREALKLLNSKAHEKNNFTGEGKKVWERGRKARLAALKKIVAGKPITDEDYAACSVGCPQQAWEPDGTHNHTDEGSEKGREWWFESQGILDRWFTDDEDMIHADIEVYMNNW